MNRINVRSKGANGEREAAKWLQSKFNLQNTPERNLDQVRAGGHDLLGFPPFCLEIKRCETLAYRDWWIQVIHSVTPTYSIPVVMYRQNKKEWKFLVSATNVGIRNGFIIMEAREFVLWASLQLDLITRVLRRA